MTRETALFAITLVALPGATEAIRKDEADATTFNAGRLGELEIAGDEIILGDPIVFTADNIDEYDF